MDVAFVRRPFQGYALLCVGFPSSDVEVETQDEDEASTANQLSHQELSSLNVQQELGNILMNYDDVAYLFH